MQTSHTSTLATEATPGLHVAEVEARDDRLSLLGSQLETLQCILTVNADSGEAVANINLDFLTNILRVSIGICAHNNGLSRLAETKSHVQLGEGSSVNDLAAVLNAAYSESLGNVEENVLAEGTVRLVGSADGLTDSLNTLIAREYLTISIRRKASLNGTSSRLVLVELYPVSERRMVLKRSRADVGHDIISPSENSLCRTSLSVTQLAHEVVQIVRAVGSTYA